VPDVALIRAQVQKTSELALRQAVVDPEDSQKCPVTERDEMFGQPHMQAARCPPERILDRNERHWSPF
jgi:hypothetical protein